jgi:hypothetical protein
VNEIRFQISRPIPFDRTSGVRVLIDDVDLVELVREWEVGLAEAEGSPGLAGSYAGLHPGNVNDPERCGFLGNKAWDSMGRVAVLGCECGESGCWPLLCRVDFSDDLVVWSDFRQPHRPSWDYREFGPFTFDRRQYLESLEALLGPG